MKSTTIGIITLLLAASANAYAQQTDETLAPLLQIPKSYTILKTTEALNIDGKNDEKVWEKVPWSDSFVDLEGKPEKKPTVSSRFKLLWDNEYLYIYCRFDEEHIWATLKEHDQSIFQDNAFEMFIDPDGDTHNYMEFQINAYAAIWDLIMVKPYRNGGPSLTDWDIKGLKKAVYVDGTLNNANDKDKFWGIEMAFPLNAFRFSGRNSMPKVGTTWKMNITRVQREVDIKDGAYVKRTGTNGRPVEPTYTCWSPPGVVNFHFPERYGVVRFAEENQASPDFVDKEAEMLKLKVWKYYYLQQEYKLANNKYAKDWDTLAKAFPNVNFKDTDSLKLSATDQQFIIETENTKQKTTFYVDHESKFGSKLLQQ
jgi:hypothetical protein